MTERTQQVGDGEFAVCHVCDHRFQTQAALDVHLMEEHEGDLLADTARQTQEQTQEPDGR